MIAVFNVARNNCRGILWKTLQSKPQSLGNGTLVTQKESSLLKHKPTALFSTSHRLCAAAAAHDHSHSRIWTAERFLSAALIGILPAAVAFPNPALDYVLALSMTVHVHWGIEAIVVDYVRPSVVGAVLSRAAVATVYALSVLTLGGLFYFNYTDVGLSQAIRMLWKL
ncbi:succinate dehydrogenase cytochrome b small subunit, mitochondrial [Trichonephila clavata]|uniref:Succinate dehydrogenase [ubiquinone] cytochrome b small subunit n=1 Tax=Trichonephila clavata TaxID=2740835 RepID=A0A8X6HV69_TRICU|nr:succinate dehydrogenase cytochrome b small subunit, mitochondrial [Trichonephila clavata]